MSNGLRTKDRNNVKNQKLEVHYKQNMKRFFRLLLFFSIPLIGIVLSTCGKKTCEAGVEGYFIYLSNPYKVDDKWIRAYFIPQQDALYNIDTLTLDMINNDGMDGYIKILAHEIYGSIPKKFRQLPDVPIKVQCLLSSHFEYGYSVKHVDKIICISASKITSE